MTKHGTSLCLYERGKFGSGTLYIDDECVPWIRFGDSAAPFLQGDLFAVVE